MADGSGAGLPSSNRGVSGFRQDNGLVVGIDWLAASVDLLAVLREQGISGPHKERLDTLDTSGANAGEVAAHLFAFFFAGCGLALSAEVKPGRFYPWRVAINDAAGTYVGGIELGSRQAERGSTVRKDGTVTARIELTGDGCRLFASAGSGHAKRWLELQAKLEAVAGRLTRCDVAADDLTGLFPVRLAMEWREQGEFDNRGQRPKARLYDDLGSGDGKTFYIGSSASEKQLRVYEKGRELGDPDSDWVRWEAQFKASNRKELPLDMLRNPAGFLLGAYPVLRFLEAMAQRIDVTDAAMAATWKSCRRHLKRQYGATLAFVVKHTHDDAQLARVIRTLTSPKLPAWACTEAANSWPEIVALQAKENADE